MDTDLAPSPVRAPPAAAGAVTWYVWAAVLAVSSAVIGGQWDISWHRSIGRDTFFSPPHIAIYLGGIISGLTCGYLILSTTFAAPSAEQAAARAASVRIWGFRGPLGAFICAWGGIAMIASAPFDNWWHDTYGLDVKILSPPHTVLVLGLLAIQVGALILIAGLMNRASGPRRALLQALFLYVGGFILVGVLTFEMEFTGRVLQHSGTFYRWVASSVPLILVAIGRASGHRFGATITAGIYSGVLLLLLWILPLVPATPKLGPVFHEVTHLIPAGFPLLLLFPALAIDLVAPRLAAKGALVQALLLGGLFLLVFFPLQWAFADFLMSPYGRNWVFGSHYFGYNTRRVWSEVRYKFYDLDGSPQGFRVQLALAVVLSMVAARIGLGWAGWMRGLRR